jgi:hypothetical protein
VQAIVRGRAKCVKPAPAGRKVVQQLDIWRCRRTYYRVLEAWERISFRGTS